METRYRIIYQDPDDPDGGLGVITPAPEWMRKAMSGELMPIWVHWKLQDEWDKAAKEGRTKTFKHSEHLLALRRTAKRLPPLNERQALEYLCLKDLPRSCWAKNHNRQFFKIVDVDEVPSDRSFRNAWEMAYV